MTRGIGTPAGYDPVKMPLPTEITNILSQLGLPAGAIALSTGLVKGAKALEKDASEAAIKYISDLLKRGDLNNLGKLVTSLVPALFDRIFGTKPLSLKFIFRSIIATTFFILLFVTINYSVWSVRGGTYRVRPQREQGFRYI